MLTQFTRYVVVDSGILYLQQMSSEKWMSQKIISEMYKNGKQMQA